MLTAERCGCLLGRLAQGLMTDTALDFMRIATVGHRHGQGFGKRLPGAGRAGADETTGAQQKRGAVAKELRALYLAQTIAVDV